jgi:hypothetical protein
MFKVNVTARNPKREELATQPLAALVDTGSELTWLEHVQLLVETFLGVAHFSFQFKMLLG